MLSTFELHKVLPYKSIIAKDLILALDFESSTLAVLLVKN